MSSSFLGSLLLTLGVSFLAPLTLVGSTIGSCLLLNYIFPSQGMSRSAIEVILEVLRVLGAGEIWHGLLLPSLAFSIVGILFNTFHFYRYQDLGSSKETL